MPRQSNARAAYLETTADLLRRQGYAATGLGQIIETSGAPKGSFYHFFPQGKEQLAAEAVREASQEVAKVFTTTKESAASPGDLVRRFAALEATQMDRSGFELGCPIATVTLEMATRSEIIRSAAGDALRTWRAVLAEAMVEAGLDDAESLATWVLSSLEGALVLARAWQDSSVIVDSASHLADALDSLSAPAQGPPSRRRRAKRRRSARTAP